MGRRTTIRPNLRFPNGPQGVAVSKDKVRNSVGHRNIRLTLKSQGSEFNYNGSDGSVDFSDSRDEGDYDDREANVD
jgi:hypothetical protein